jgi:hypothetical protein
LSDASRLWFSFAHSERCVRDACFGMCAGAPYRTESWLDKIRAVRIAVARRVSPGARRMRCAAHCGLRTSLH